MQELEVVKENKKEVKFMKGVKTIQQLREVMQKGEMTSEYWADAWAIAALEIILNIKFINLSYNDFNQNQRKSFQEINVINCGNDLSKSLIEEIRKNVAEVSKAGGLGSGAGAAAASADMGGKKSPDDYEFNPDYYIMISHAMEHYELITYYGNAMLTFPEIPYCVKLQIVTRCLQGKFFNGAYSHIPQFKLFIQELGIAKKVEGRMVDESVDALSAAASGANGDITSLTGLSTALSVSQGGTGATSFSSGYFLVGGGTTAVTATNSITGSAVSGNISGNAANVTGVVAIANGGTSATTAPLARTALSAAASGANSDITSITGLSTALAVGQGGTGNSVTATNNYIAVGDGTKYVPTSTTDVRTLLGIGTSTSKATGSLSFSSTTTVPVTHALATTAVLVQTFDSGGVLVDMDVTVTNSTTVTFVVAATTATSYSYVIIG
jgi:hypothetical protein